MKKDLCILVLIVCLLLIPNKLFGQGVLFSVPYGQQDAQIYMFIPNPNLEDAGEAAGPGWFFVDANNDKAYIDLKMFSLNGEFIGKIQPPNDPIFKYMRSSCFVDNDGNIYSVMKHPLNGYDNVAKISKYGSIIWARSLLDIVAQDKRYEDVGEGFYVDTQGNIYMQTDFRANSVNQTVDEKYLKLDSGGNLLGEVPSCYLDKAEDYFVFNPVYSTGKLYGTVLFGDKYHGDYVSGANVEVYDQQNHLTKKIVVDLPAEYKQSSYFRTVSQWNVDPAGNVYAVANITRDKSLWSHIVGDVFEISDDYYVYKFNQKGHLEFKAKIDGYPIGTRKVVQIDDAQNVYYLQFYADHLDVMKVKTDTISPEVDIAIKPERLDNDKDKDDRGKQNKDKNDKKPHKDKDEWYIGAVQAILTARDNEWGSGVKELHYSLTGAVSAEEVLTTSEATFAISTEGTTVIKAYAVDYAENIGSSETATIRIRGKK